MNWYAGTSGYSYKTWKGSFYPEDLSNQDFLSYYASQLPAVEINNTFYRMPRREVLESWHAAVPDDFRFVIKASRRITHQHRLKNAEEATGYLLTNLEALGSKLGAVLFQLPPNLPCDLDRLAAFLGLLPAALPVTFEFRHPSWDDPAVLGLLAEHGAALCVTDDEGTAPQELPETARLLYLRLRGAEYTDAVLRRWIALGRASGAERAFAFFKHEDAGAGPVLARRFLELSHARPRKAPRRAETTGSRQKRRSGSA